LRMKEETSFITKVQRKRKQRLGEKRAFAARIFLAASIMIIYLLLSMPYLIHTNLGNAGTIAYSKQTTIESLPKDVQEICKLRGFNPTAVLLVKHAYPRWTTLVVASSEFSTGALVEMYDYIVDWRVNWRDFNLIDQAFDRLAVTEVKQLDPPESWIEGTLSNPFGGYLLDLSLVDFYVGPVLTVLCVTLLASRRLALWNTPAIWGFYSFQVWMATMIASIHNIYMAPEWTYFGYSFLGLLPLTIYIWHFEQTEAGKSIADKMRAISKFLGLAK